MSDELPPFSLLREVEGLNNGSKPPVNYGAWLAKPWRKEDPAPVARPRKRRAQPEPEPPQEWQDQIELLPGESYEEAITRLLGDESQERLADALATLREFGSEPEKVNPDPEPEPEEEASTPWWSSWWSWLAGER